jgi:YVTN family beta-propeller protein
VLRRPLVASLAVAAVLAGVPDAPAGADTLLARVPVGFVPVDVAVNPLTGRAYVANVEDQSVSVITPGAATATVATGRNPGSVAVNPATNRVYVANRVDDGLTVIDGDTNATVSGATGTTPTAIAVNVRSNKVYVANAGSDDVTVLDGATNAVHNVAVGRHPSALAVNETTNRVYGANLEAGTVTVIDGATDATASITVGSEPSAIAVNETTNRIYVANSASSNVTVIDGATNATATIAAGRGPVALAINESTNKVYVANVVGASMTVIDGPTKATSTVSVGDGPVAVAVNEAKNKVYVANSSSSTVTVLDAGSGATVAMRTGRDPRALAVDVRTNRVYVADAGDDDVTVIDGSSAVANVTIDQTRVAGADRYATAAALDADVEPGVATAYVATGQAYADALALGPVAGDDAALLLTRRDDVPEATADELRRLAPGRIVIVGGTGAVSAAVASALDAYTTGPVERVAGSSRYETAVALSTRAFPAAVGTVHLVSGEGFADAVSTGQAAAATGGPILLVGRDELPAVVGDELERLGPTHVIVAGGSAAVSDAVLDAVRARLPEADVVRVAGDSRYSTAVALADRADASGDTVFVATGESFADALAATPGSIRAGAPVLLVPRTGTVPAAVVDAVRRFDPDVLTIVGGSGAIPQAIIDQLS